MLLDLFDRLSAQIADGDCAGCRIITVGAHFLLQCRLLQRQILRGRETCDGRLQPKAKQRFCFTVQPVRAPVRRDIAAMPPD